MSEIKIEKFNCEIKIIYFWKGSNLFKNLKFKIIQIKKTKIIIKPLSYMATCICKNIYRYYTFFLDTISPS